MLTRLALPMTFLVLMLDVPGYLFLRSFRQPRTWSFCVAPAITIGLVGILGELYGICGFPATPATVFLPLVLVFGLPCLPYPSKRAESHDAVAAVSPPWWLPLLFIAVGMAACNSVYLSKIDSPNAVLQSYDVTHHLNIIQAFYDARRISSLGVCPYLSAPDAAIMPYGITSFYPSAWYGICALLMQVTKISAPEAILASMGVFSGVVLPLGSLALSSLVFAERGDAVLAHSLTAVSFVAFPWCMLLFGPLYPNFAGFATLPATSALFLVALTCLESHGKALEVMPFVIASAGQALLHPNTLFAIFLMFFPYCAWRVYRFVFFVRKKSRISACVAAALFVAACGFLWVVCYRSPAFGPIVGEYWPNFAYAWQEIINIVTQTYLLGFYVEMATPLVLGTLVIVGWVCCAYDNDNRWLAVSYVVVCAVNFIGASSPSVTLKQFVAGFWYTDAVRLSAMACLLASLLAARGFAWTYEAACSIARRYNEEKGRQTHPHIVAGVLACLFLALTFMPGFNWPGAHTELTEAQFNELKREGREYETMSVKTTFGDYRQLVRNVYAVNAPVDSQEWEFLDEVAQIVPAGSLIINNPMDGSFLAYGGRGLRVYYREFGYEGGSTETPESVLVRTNLCNIATDAEVRAAVESLGAEYVLVMNVQNSERSFINLRGDYSPQAFAGISSISPATVGFTALLTNGACTLYRID